LNVLFVASEIAPWVKTGGLGDVAAALPEALRVAGADVRVLVPAYPALKAAFPAAPLLATLPSGNAFHGAALRAVHTAQGMPLYLLECDACFDRSGNPYLGPGGRDWPDNALRFGLLARIAALLAGTASPLAWRPDVLHCNDWQTALAPAYLHYLPHGGARAATVVTIHNLAFQGLFSRDLLPALNLPEHAWAIDGVEYHGHLSFLKAGLQFADAITTVSPAYAQEIQTEAGGMGMNGLLRHRAEHLRGILNGIDTVQWNPAADPVLAKPYDARRLAAKVANTVALRAELGLADAPKMPLLGIISRFTEQKGLDLVAGIAVELAALPVQLAVLGSGERSIEQTFRTIAAQRPQQFAVRIGFDERLAHRIEAGADIFLMPSRFEPCGLNQMYSLRYGTPPIVRATGGLTDTVIDAAEADGNGFVFSETTPEALLAAIRRAAMLWRDTPRWRKLQRRGMQADFGWGPAAQRYIDLYQSLLTP